MSRLYKTEYSSPLGKITLASDGKFITGAWFEGQKYFPDADMEEKRAPFSAALFWLDTYFEGKKPSCPKFADEGGSGLLVAPVGSSFRQRVYRALLKIPYGKTSSYGEIAASLRVNSARATGGAVSRNPVSIFIPCHRVIGANGALTGYAGGLERKIALLKLEGAKIDRP